MEGKWTDDFAWRGAVMTVNWGHVESQRGRGKGVDSLGLGDEDRALSGGDI